MVKAIIFDIGGVVYLRKMEDTFSKLNDFLGLSKNFINDLFFKNKDDLLIGKISSLEFCKLIIDNSDLNLSPKDVYDKWVEAWVKTSGLNEGIIKIIKKLKEKYEVGCLSDATKFDVEMDKKTGIEEYFNPYVNSCDFGMTKTNKRMFELVLEKLNVSSEECIFIDDRTKHLVIPKELGAKTIHFKNNQQLLDKLKEAGVIF